MKNRMGLLNFLFVLKAYHRKLLDFLNYEGKPLDDIKDVETFINTKLEHLEKLKFDEEQWEVHPTNFTIDGMLYFNLTVTRG